MTLRRACVSATATALMLAACGGGGSDGGASPAPTPPASTRGMPLSLSTVNASDVASISLAYGVIALGFGQLADDWVAIASAAPAVISSSACAGGGTGAISVSDRDGNGRLGPGDRVTVVLSSCYLRPVDDPYSGTATIDIVALTEGVPPQWTGTLGFGTSFGLQSGGTTIALQGSFLVASTPSRLTRSLRVTSTSEPFAIAFSAGTASASDFMSQVDVRREIRRDTVRTQSSFAYHLESDSFGGSVDVATVTPWASWFDSEPDAGELSATGAARATVSLKAFTNLFTVGLNGVTTGTVPSEGATTGYPWSGTGWLPQDPAAVGYTTRPASTIGFVALVQPAATLAPNPGPIEWLWSRPLAAGAVNSVSFVRTTSGAGADWAPARIAATFTVEGGLLTATPTSELEPGNGYLVLFDDTTVGTIGDIFGATLPRPSASVTVTQTVQATATIESPGVLVGPGATLGLDASTSTAARAPVASTSWRQISGPPLVITGASAPRAVVAPADATIGPAVVEVEVRNAAGDYDRQQITLQVYGSLADVVVFALRVDAGATTYAVGAPGGSTYAHYLAPPTNVIDVFLGTPRFIASLPAGTAWQTGVDVSYGPGGTPGVNGVFNSTFDVCAVQAGHFKVLDFATDGAGKLTRLAVDVEDLCKPPSITYGSIRYNSAVPVRP